MGQGILCGPCSAFTAGLVADEALDVLSGDVGCVLGRPSAGQVIAEDLEGLREE